MAEEPSTAVIDSPGGVERGTSEGSPSGGAEGTPAPTGDASPETPRGASQREPTAEFSTKVAESPATTASLEEARDATETLLNWRDMADPEYRKSPVLAKYTSVGEALKALVHQEELLGRSIAIPRAGAGEAQMRAFYTKLGCPETPDGYTITDPDMGVDAAGQPRRLDANFVASVMTHAHAHGYTQPQAQAMVDYAAQKIVDSEKIQAGEQAMRKAQAERQLYEAFGSDSATMLQKAQMAFANIGAGRYGGGQYAQDAVAAWKASALANDVAMVATLANMFDNYKEGQMIEGAGGILSSREQIEADITALGAIRNDATKSFDERNAAHQRQFKLYQDLAALNEQAAARQGTRR